METLSNRLRVRFFRPYDIRPCASYHGVQRQGGIRMMLFFWIKSPPLTRQALFAEADHEDGHENHELYTPELFARAIRQGIDPSGKALSTAMPRWKISEPDMHVLLTFLKQSEYLARFIPQMIDVVVYQLDWRAMELLPEKTNFYVI